MVSVNHDISTATIRWFYYAHYLRSTLSGCACSIRRLGLHCLLLCFVLGFLCELLLGLRLLLWRDHCCDNGAARAIRLVARLALRGLLSCCGTVCDPSSIVG